MGVPAECWAELAGSRCEHLGGEPPAGSCEELPGGRNLQRGQEPAIQGVGGRTFWALEEHVQRP